MLETMLSRQNADGICVCVGGGGGRSWAAKCPPRRTLPRLRLPKDELHFIDGILTQR